MYHYNGKQYPCCTSLTMGLIGGKWKTVILYHLKDETLRYNLLKKKIPTVTERTLSLQLKALESDGLIKRQVHTDKPPLKVEYSLSKFGKTVIPLIDTIAEWGNLVAKEHSR